MQRITPKIHGCGARTLRAVAVAVFVAWGSAPAVARAGQSCAGDCDANGVVTVDEIVTAVRIGFGDVSVAACMAGDRDNDGSITIDEVLGAVNSALLGCSGTPGPPPGVLYVRQTGSDLASGRDPQTALRSITRAARLARNGYLIVVGPGIYPGTVTLAKVGSSVPQGLSFFADTRGMITGDSPAAVIVDAGGQGPGFDIANSAPATVMGRTFEPTIDGFTVRGAGNAGIVIRGGASAVIQGCTVTDTAGDGIRIEGTPNALVFNNLLYDNSGVGVGVIQGADAPRILNNTMTLNTDHGISVGTASQASSNAVIRNNLIQDNGGNASIEIVPPGDQGYMGGFNLVLPDVYNPTRLRRVQDLHDDAQFVDPVVDNFALQASSPGLNTGTALNDIVTLDRARVIGGAACFVTNDSACKVTLSDYLNRRSATGGNSCDRGALDLGFHSLPDEECR